MGLLDRLRASPKNQTPQEATSSSTNSRFFGVRKERIALFLEEYPPFFTRVTSDSMRFHCAIRDAPKSVIEAESLITIEAGSLIVRDYRYTGRIYLRRFEEYEDNPLGSRVDIEAHDARKLSWILVCLNSAIPTEYFQ